MSNRRGNLDIVLCRSFVAVVDCQGMTGAAAYLNLTQGAISQQVRRLEDMLHCRLFHRRHQQLRLTVKGEAFLPRARQILALNDLVWAEMVEPDPHGEIRLGMPNDLVPQMAAGVFAGFGREHPNIALSLVCAASPELRDMVMRGAVDLALIEEPMAAENPDSLHLEPLRWVGRKGGRAGHVRPLPLSLVNQECAFRPVIAAALDRSDIAVRMVVENGTLDATLAAVHADIAITAMLESTVPDGLAVVDVDYDLPALPVFSVNLVQSPLATGRAMAELVRYFRKLTRLNHAAE